MGHLKIQNTKYTSTKGTTWNNYFSISKLLFHNTKMTALATFTKEELLSSEKTCKKKCRCHHYLEISAPIATMSHFDSLHMTPHNFDE